MKPSSSLPDHGRITVHYLHGRAKRRKSLTIALSVQCNEYPQRFLWAEENAFALEYTPDPLLHELIPAHVRPYASCGIPVRFHTRFSDYEIGDTDAEKAEAAVRVHYRVIDAMPGLGEPVVTVHLNLNSGIPFHPLRAVENLARLVERGRYLGVTVCLENLRRGPTSDPNNVLNWAGEAGAMITLDIGHAVSSDYVKSGKATVPDIIDIFREKLYEVHMYGKEEDRHYPVEDMALFEPIVDRLLETDCGWWTIELNSCEEALDTRTKLLEYLASKK